MVLVTVGVLVLVIDGVIVLVGVIVGVELGDAPGVSVTVTVGVIVGVTLMVGVQTLSAQYAQYGPSPLEDELMQVGVSSYWVEYFQYP